MRKDVTKEKFRWNVESIAVIILMTISIVLVFITAWFTLLTGQDTAPSILHAIAAIMGIVVFSYSLVKFYSMTNRLLYVTLLAPFVVIIVSILVNWINGRELLSQDTSSVIIYLSFILILCDNLKDMFKK